ncbi:hypothetical protein EVAR_55436_1 [Eumeta japonica]|uniref:Uncharacterized protein n=1 Tax=Eumeta variegata TaxID=151549 RepID=A0A4C1Y6D7_EUMVA|nr:hypothetical protein EVAR_55436_1 [Eumeta japonica]
MQLEYEVQRKRPSGFIERRKLYYPIAVTASAGQYLSTFLETADLDVSFPEGPDPKTFPTRLLPDRAPRNNPPGVWASSRHSFEEGNFDACTSKRAGSYANFVV